MSMLLRVACRGSRFSFRTTTAQQSSLQQSTWIRSGTSCCNSRGVMRFSSATGSDEATIAQTTTAAAAANNDNDNHEMGESTAAAPPPPPAIEQEQGKSKTVGSGTTTDTGFSEPGLFSSLLPDATLSLQLPTAKAADVAATATSAPPPQQEQQQDQPSVLRASKPRVVAASKVARPKFSPNMNNQAKPKEQLVEPPPFKTWGDHLADSGVRVTYQPWIIIEGISPVSSLETMTEAIEELLNDELKRGIIDLDAPFVRATKAPMIKITDQDIANRSRDDQHPYIQEARLILSPYARPSGWYVRLAHRSMAQALLVRFRTKGDMKIGYKQVRCREYQPATEFAGNLPKISDAVIRVENCPDNCAKVSFLNFFSRFDLSTEHESVVQWTGVTPDGKMPSSCTYLVHFSDPSWARAAIREKQGAFLRGHQVRLAQFPRQIVA